MIKVGVIGAGRIGKVHMTSINNGVPDAVVKTVADPFMNEEMSEWAKKHGVEHTTKDYKEILNDPEIKAVLICSSTNTHVQLSLEAIAAGKHVFCEKPIDHDIKNIEKVKMALEGSGLKYMVGFNRRFDHNFDALKKAVKEGKIGRLEMVKITSRDPEPPSADYVKVSGGMFLDMTIHDFDMVRFLSDADVDEVYAIASNVVDPSIGEAGDIDTAIISLKLSNGALAVIDNSRRAVYGYDQRAEVFGSEGMAEIKNDTATSTIISNKESISSEKPLFFFLERYIDAYAKEMRDFINAIVNDEEVPVGIDDGLKPVLIAKAAKKSYQENRPVKISEIEMGE